MKPFLAITALLLAIGLTLFYPKEELEVKFMNIPKPDFYQELGDEQKKFYDSLDIPTQKKVFRHTTASEQKEEFDKLWKQNLEKKEID